MGEAHQRDFSGFGIRFDHYGSTHSEENREVCHEIWTALRKADMIESTGLRKKSRWEIKVEKVKKKV